MRLILSTEEWDAIRTSPAIRNYVAFQPPGQDERYAVGRFLIGLALSHLPPGIQVQLLVEERPGDL